jgi:hypothetical protein
LQTRTVGSKCAETVTARIKGPRRREDPCCVFLALEREDYAIRAKKQGAASKPANILPV